MSAPSPNSLLGALEKIYADLKNGRTEAYTQAEMRERVDAYLKGAAEGNPRFKNPDFTTPYYSQYEIARQNLYNFSGASSYQSAKFLNEALIGDGARFASFEEFREKVFSEFKEYKTAWLESEYLTAKAQAEAQARWHDIIDNADIFPNLKYKTIGDDFVREEHAALNNFVATINDPIWNKIYPPNGWRCRCYAEGTSEPPSDKRSIPKISVPQNFANNVGRTSEFFRENHAMFKNMSKDAIQKVTHQAYILNDADRIARSRQSYEMYPAEARIGFDPNSGGYIVAQNREGNFSDEQQAVFNVLKNRGVGVVLTDKVSLNNQLFHIQAFRNIRKSDQVVSEVTGLIAARVANSFVLNFETLPSERVLLAAITKSFKTTSVNNIIVISSAKMQYFDKGQFVNGQLSAAVKKLYEN